MLIARYQATQALLSLLPFYSVLQQTQPTNYEILLHSTPTHREFPYEVFSQEGQEFAASHPPNIYLPSAEYRQQLPDRVGLSDA